MKTWFAMFLLALSVQAIADTTYTCSSKKGVITVVDHAAKGVTLDFSQHPVAPDTRCVFCGYLLENDQKDGVVVIFAEQASSYGMGSYTNNARKLVVKNSNSHDWSTTKVKLSLDKKKRKMAFSLQNYEMSFFPNYSMKDKLVCQVVSN